MGSIVWTVGKIGLLILGTLLLLLAAVLLVPIRYRVQAEKGEALRADLRLSWLCGIAQMRAGCGPKPFLRVRALGILLYDLQKQAEKKPRKSRKKKKKQKPETKAEKRAAPGQAQDAEETAAANQAQNAEETAAANQAQNAKETAAPGQEPNIDETAATNQVQNAEEAAAPQPLPGKIASFARAAARGVRAFWRALKRIPETLRALLDRLRHLAEQAAFYRDLWQREETRRAAALVKKQLWRLWRHVRPGKGFLRLTLGFSDPATTGEVLALYSALAPWLPGGIALTPDFERDVQEGALRLQGRVRLLTLLRIGWTLYFDRNIAFLRRQLGAPRQAGQEDSVS